MSIGKALAEHRQPADRLGADCLVLQNIPVFGELAVLETDDIGGNPDRGTAVAGEAPMRDDVVALRHNQLVLVAERLGRRPDEVEQALSAGGDMSAVLDVAVGPELFGGRVVALVEERIERLQDNRFVLLGSGFRHWSLHYAWMIQPATGSSVG